MKFGDTHVGMPVWWDNSNCFEGGDEDIQIGYLVGLYQGSVINSLIKVVVQTAHKKQLVLYLAEIHDAKGIL